MPSQPPGLRLGMAEGVTARIYNLINAYAIRLMELAFDADNITLVLETVNRAGVVISDPVVEARCAASNATTQTPAATRTSEPPPTKHNASYKTQRTSKSLTDDPNLRAPTGERRSWMRRADRT